MEFRVLGPLEVREGDRSVPLGGRKQRALLALLLLNANQVVSLERLIDDLWGENPPETAVATVQVYVSRLRRTLGAGRIETRSPGYLFRLGEGELDLDRFEDLVARGDSGSVREALALWRGEPLADFTYEAFAQGPIARISELRMAALERRIDGDLAEGVPTGLIAEIDELVRRNPLRERLRSLQLVALYRAGRQTEALAAYRAARSLLTEELGLEPSEELKRVERQILTHDPALDAAPGAVEHSTEPEPVPEAALEEARKLVTIVCCDVTAETVLTADLDPEDLRGLEERASELLAVTVERHGGTVVNSIGGEAIAAFGAPTAREDDALRAVKASLEFRSALAALGLKARIGVQSGEVIVNGSASVSGIAVAIAKRLADATGLDGVLIGELTLALTARAVDVEQATPIRLGGGEATLAAFRVLRVHEIMEPERRTRFVGRERELDVLRSALERVRAERSSQLVTLVGVPGIGKSRLVSELSRIADAEPEPIRWRQGRCLAYGEGVTLWALAEIVKAQAAILEADTADDAARKLHGAVAEAIADPQEAAWVEARLRPLAGLETGSELAVDRRGESFAAWRRFLEALADQRPLIAVFEDLHWADDDLLDFLDELADWASSVALLLVCTARPELLSRRPSWGGGKLNAATVALPPLSDTETALLIAQALERSVLPDDAQRSLLDRAEGNPLYAEQFALLYAERGSADDLPVPENLQGIIAARLDGLPSAEKALLLDASVVGKVFWTGCIGLDAYEAEPLLRELRRKGFIRRQLRSSVAGESEYAFAHVLVRDVAYGQIPRGERSRRHRLVAEWIQSLARPSDNAEMLAHHWRSAHDLARAAGSDHGDLAERARLALRDAGDRASALNAHAAAERYYAAALELWPPDDPTRADLLLRHARALDLAADERREPALAEARDALAAAGDRAQAALASACLSRIAWLRGARGEWLEHLDAAEQLAAAAPPSEAKTRVLAISARQRTLAGDSALGIQLAEQALAMARGLDLTELEAVSLATIGTALSDSGEGGLDELELALEIAEAANSPEAAAILVNLAVAAAKTGDIGRQDKLMAEAEETADRFGNRDYARFARGNRVWTRWAVGEWDEALAMANAFIAECERDPRYGEHLVRGVRGWIRLGRGDTDAAIADLERAVEQGQEVGDPQALLRALAECSYGYARVGRLEEARALAADALAYLREHPKMTMPVGTATPLAGALGILGIEDALREILEAAPDGAFEKVARAIADGDQSRAAELYAAMGSPTLEAFHRVASAEALLAAGLREQGEAEVERALAFYRSVSATFYVERAEALLGAVREA